MATHLLRLYTSAGTALNTFPIWTEEFNPIPCRVDPATIEGMVRNGQDPDLLLPPIEQPWSGMLLDNSPTKTVRQALNEIEAVLVQAAIRKTRRAGVRAFLEVDVDGAGDYWRSEIFGGDVALQSGELGIPWLAGKVRISGTLLRSFCWEGAKTAITLTNGHGGGSGGIQIDNAHDVGGRDNYGAFAGIDGVVPAPIHVSLENTLNDPANTYRIYAGQMVLFSGATFPSGVREGELGDGGVDHVCASCSNDGYSTFAVPAADGRITYWSLTGGTGWLRTDQVRHWLIQARVHSAVPTGMVASCKIAFPTGATTTPIVWTNPVVLTAGAHSRQVLGILRIAPWLAGDTSTLASMQLELWGYVAGGGSLDLDCLDCVPLDHWRIYNPITRGLAFGDTFNDDATEGLIYVDHDAGGITGHSGLYIPQGPGLYAWPGKTQAMIFYETNDAGAAEVDRTHTLTAWYRPRRLTL